MGLKQGTRPVRLVKLIGLVGLVALAASGCTSDQALHFGWPQAITPQGTKMRDFWMWAGFASLAVGAHRVGPDDLDGVVPPQAQGPRRRSCQGSSSTATRWSSSWSSYRW